MEKDFLSFKDTAMYLCVSKSFLYKATHRNQIRYYKIGRLNLFRLTDLKKYIENNAVLSKDDLKRQAQTRVVIANISKTKAPE